MIRNLTRPLVLVLLLLTLAVGASAADYAIDPSHSSVAFTVRHMVVSKVRGSFTSFSGTFQFEEDAPKSWRVQASIDAATVDTNNEKRDEHLRSADFFDVEQFPTLDFVSKQAKAHEDGYLLVGDLTLHGITREVELELEYNGSVKDPWGMTRAGFSATGSISRKDFGLTYNSVLESGGLAVGDEVTILIDVEGILKQ